MRYLNQAEINTKLNLGKTIEQWLTPRYDKVEELEVLRWIEVDKEGSSSYILRILEVYDHGDSETLDFYAFSSVDADNEYEEIDFEDVSRIMEFVESKLGGASNRFLNQGVCQEEYKLYLEQKK